MASESQAPSFMPPSVNSHPVPVGLNQKDIKAPEMVQADNPPGAPGQPGNVPRDNKGNDVPDHNATDNQLPDGEEPKSDDKSSDKDRYKQSSDAKPKIEVPLLDQKPDAPVPRPILQQNPPNYRPPITPHNPPMKPGNHMAPGLPNQPVRKPDSAGMYQQSYPSQPRQNYQMPNTGYSTSSYQPPPPSQTYSTPQIKTDMSRGNFHYPSPSPNLIGQGPVQRSYPPTQNYDLSQQNRPAPPRPHLAQPILNRPPMYQSGSAPRGLPDQKYIPPPRPSFTVSQPMTANPLPGNPYYTPMRTTPLSPVSPTPTVPSSIGDSGPRMYRTDTDASKPKPPLSPDPRYASPDPNRNKPITDSVQPKKPEVEEVKPVAEQKVEKVDEGEKAAKQEVTVPVTESKKEPGIVQANVKFFEERDKAKIPLTPKLSSPLKSTPLSRSATFTSSNVVKGDVRGAEKYESGVDETPLLHPNLRSIFREKPLDLQSRKGTDQRAKRQRSAPSRDTNKSYPSTPVRFSPSIGRAESSLGVSRSPSKSYKSIFEFTPEEELLYFFNIAKANYHSIFDRNHVSRIDDASHRKENMPTANGDIHGVKKTPTRLPAPAKRSSSASSPTKTPLKSPGVPKSLPKTPDSPAPPAPLIKKVPMNKIQVGAAPSPNLKAVKSKIGSLANTTHKPGGGNIKIESHKVDFSKAQARIAAKNENYAPGGGDKKIQQVKLQWAAKPKVGSLENAAHKPGGGDKKIESVKLDFKDKAKPKVGSKDNVKHVPGGGAVKIESQKLEFKAQSKVGSLDNVKHKPGGGDVKIFDDKTYLKQISCNSSEGRASGTQSYCDLSIVSEVHSVSAPGTPHHGTAIKIKKSTTLGKTKPEIRKTTEVTVVSRSPSIERKDMIKSPSTHEVKLTYAKVASPKHGKPGLDNVGPVEVVNVPASENAAILKPDDTPVEVKNLISSFEQITSSKGIAFDGKNVLKTRPEPSQPPTPVSEELNQMFSPVREELDRVTQDRSKQDDVESAEDETPASKFLRNEMAAHEKVGEMWKEVHNIVPEKSKPEEKTPPPPPTTPSAAPKFGFQQGMPQPPSPRQPSPRGPFPPQNPLRPQNPNPQMGMRPPPMQPLQRPPFQNPQMRPPFVNPQGQRMPFPEFQGKPGMAPMRPPGDATDTLMTPQLPQQSPSPVRMNFNPPK